MKYIEINDLKPGMITMKSIYNDRGICLLARNKILTNPIINQIKKMGYDGLYIYDEYYSKCTRDSAFLKDLVDSLQGISAVLEVYVSNEYIHPSYALEKLKYSQRIIDSTIKYFENKEKENGK